VVVAFGSVTAGLGAALWQAHVASLERTRAERRFHDVRELSDSLLFEFHDAIADLPGSTPVRKRLVDRALKYLASLAREVEGDQTLQEQLAHAYQRIGDVQGGPSSFNLGESAAALDSYRHALRIHKTLAAAQPESAEAQRHASENLQRIAQLQIRLGQVTEAMNTEREALGIDQAICKAGGCTSQDRERLAADYEILGDLFGGIGVAGSLADPHQALENHRQSLDIRSTLVAVDDTSVAAKDGVARLKSKVADDLLKLGDRKGALAYYAEALTGFESLVAGASDLKMRTRVGVMQSKIADAFLMGGDALSAARYYRLALNLAQEILKADPTNAEFEQNVAGDHASLGITLVMAGQVADGLEELRVGEKILEHVLARDPHNGEMRSGLALLSVWFATGLQTSGDTKRAMSYWRRAEGVYQSLVRADPSDIDSRLNLAATASQIGGVLTKAGNQDEARKAYAHALELAENFAAAQNASQAARYVVADAYAGLGRVATAAGLWSEATAWFRRSLSMWQLVRNPGVVSPNGFFFSGPDVVRRELARCERALRVGSLPADR
jgi:eukaryotic-like serine/threonine-protein kinase